MSEELRGKYDGLLRQFLKLKHAEKRRRIQRIRRWRGPTRWVASLFSGTRLYRAGLEAWDDYSAWLKGRENRWPEEATRNLVAALVSRYASGRLLLLLGLGIATVTMPLLHVALLYRQTGILDRQLEFLEEQGEIAGNQVSVMEAHGELLTSQNELLSNQNSTLAEEVELLGSQNFLVQQQNHLAAFEQTTNLRRLLLAPPFDQEGKAFHDWEEAFAGHDWSTAVQALLDPDPVVVAATVIQDGETLYPSQIRSWPAPNLALVRQVVDLGRREPDLLLPSLHPLIFDRASSVSASAVVVLALLGERDLRFAHIPAAALDQATLREVDLRGANLVLTSLYRGDLEGSRFDDGVLVGARFKKSNLRGATFRRADLRAANFWCADLRGADLRDARLAGAILSGTDIRGANFAGAYADMLDSDRRVQKSAFEVDETTILPSGARGSRVSIREEAYWYGRGYPEDEVCPGTRGPLPGAEMIFRAFR